MQFQQKKYYDASTRELPELEKRTVIKVRDGKDWRPAVVLGKAKQPRSNFIRLESGQVTFLKAEIKVYHQIVHVIPMRVAGKI